MSDPLPFLNTDASLYVALVALAGLWFVARKSGNGQRVFVWAVGLVVAVFLVHNALWGTCGRWGRWQTGTPEEQRAYEDSCTEPRDPR